MNKYAEAGVDVDVESKAAKILYEASKKTFANRKGNIGEVVVPFDDFSGVRAIDVSKLPSGSFMCVGFDGIGSKALIAQKMNNHKTMAFDLLAMVCDDAIVRGAEPVLVGSNLDVSSLGTDDSRLNIVEELAEGYVSAAKAANVAIINGEIAQLGSMISGDGSMPYNWTSACVWFANKERMFTGSEIKVGDSIVVFEEKGFRSNGFSLIRKTFEDKFGSNWHDEDFEGDKLGNHVLVPSTIYSKAIVSMHGGFENKGNCEIHGVAHITGGGVPEKIGRMLKPSGFGAKLDNLFKPCKAMLYCQEVGNIPDEDAYGAWCMGQGLAVVTPEPDKVISEAKKFGLNAQLAGEVTSDSKIVIESKGVNGDKLIF